MRGTHLAPPRRRPPAPAAGRGRRLPARLAGLLVLVAASGSARAVAPPPAERPQFVLLSMDTTPNAERPVERTGFHHLLRGLNHDRRPGEPPRAYTLFIVTGGLQLAPSRRDLTAPEEAYRGTLPPNGPVISYATSVARIRAIADNVRELAAAGVEIASHGVRHADGRDFTAARWSFELSDHQRVLDLLRLPRPLGFRAPFLQSNEHLHRAERDHGMRYDASRTGGMEWPARIPGTDVWSFHLPTVRLPDGARALLFDDNLRATLRRSSLSSGLAGDLLTEAWMDRLFFRAVYSRFLRHYRENRAPLLISGHGGFRLPTIRLMRRVCGLPSVRCTTFREATRYLDAHPELAGLGRHEEP